MLMAARGGRTLIPSTELLPSRSHALSVSELFVRQKRELWELVGFETRNKYAITHSNGEEVMFAAEQGGGIGAALLRHFVGHWRSFTIRFFNPMRQEVMSAHHPFRWLFPRLEVSEMGRAIGAIQSRWALFSRRMDILDSAGNVLFEIKSPLLSPWTFPVYRHGLQVAVVEKKWSGLFNEAFTDKDNFKITLNDGTLNEAARSLILASALLIDLRYFEKKAR